MVRTRRQLEVLQLDNVKESDLESQSTPGGAQLEDSENANLSGDSLIQPSSLSTTSSSDLDAGYREGEAIRVTGGDLAVFGMPTTDRHVVVLEVFSHDLLKALMALCTR
jgi:hypothetical protein